MTEAVDKKVDEIIKKINPEEVSGIMAEMAATLLMGQQPAMADVFVKLSIPKPIYDMVSLVCKRLDVLPEEVFSRMASSGFSNSIKNLTNMATSVAEEAAEEEASEKEQPSLKAVAPGLDKLMSGFGQLNGLVTQLQTMQKAMEDAGLTNTTTGNPTKKDPQ